MKIAIGLALALALALSSAPAIAGDTFQAFSSLPALEQASLTPLPDEQLASIEGMRAEVCVVCINRARIRQTNVAFGTFLAIQSNSAYVSQQNN
jgi:hypothetical protein